MRESKDERILRGLVRASLFSASLEDSPSHPSHTLGISAASLRSSDLPPTCTKHNHNPVLFR